MVPRNAIASRSRGRWSRQLTRSEVSVPARGCRSSDFHWSHLASRLAMPTRRSLGLSSRSTCWFPRGPSFGEEVRCYAARRSGTRFASASDSRRDDRSFTGRREDGESWRDLPCRITLRTKGLETPLPSRACLRNRCTRQRCPRLTAKAMHRWRQCRTLARTKRPEAVRATPALRKTLRRVSRSPRIRSTRVDPRPSRLRFRSGRRIEPQAGPIQSRRRDQATP